MHSNLAEIYFLCYIFANEAKKKTFCDRSFLSTFVSYEFRTWSNKRIRQILFYDKTRFKYFELRTKAFVSESRKL